MLDQMLLRFLRHRQAPFVFQQGGLPLPDLSTLPSLGLYVHLPFCRELCAFCPYCKVRYDAALAKDYKSALVKEIHGVLSKGSASLPPVDSLYFGGGTPALMAEDLLDILAAFEAHLPLPRDRAMELHPEDLTQRVLEKLQEGGIRRVSIGIQTFDDALLQGIQRRQRLPDQGLALLEKADFDTVDMDLLFGLPGQTEASLLRDFSLAAALGATQISTYPFIDFSYARNPGKPLPPGKMKAFLEALTAKARDLGMERTAVWTFRRPGTLPYTSVTRERYLGFGVSAATLLEDRFSINTFHIPSYLQATEENRSATALTLSFTPEQRALYHLFWSAYGLELASARHNALTGESLEKTLGGLLPLLLIAGLLRRTPGGYRLTESGALRYHRLEQEVTHTVIDTVWGHLRSAPFPSTLKL